MEETPKKSSYPNIVFKKKLAPLPLFNQNQSPKHIFPSTSRDHLLTEPKSLRGAPEVPAFGLRSTKTLLGDLRNGTNYGRMCDQPFLEFSSFHYQQVFGSGGKKKVVLEPLDRKKKRVASSVQLVKGAIGKEPLIKVEDQAPVVPQIKIVKEKEVKDNRAVISHRYRINDNEATISFVSLKLVLTPEGNKEKKEISVPVGKDDLKKIYKYPQKAIEESVLQALAFTDKEGIVLVVTKNKNLNPGGQTLEETYPEKSGSLDVTLNNRIYSATIYYPHLELCIPELNYLEKVMLRPVDLENLFEEGFKNLPDYASKFTLPSASLNENDQYEELENLPNIIKKVVKEKNFGGLVIFKSAEIHLKNISEANETEPQKTAEEQNPGRRVSIRQKKAAAAKSTLLRIKVRDLVQFMKLSDGEIVNLIKKSIVMGEGQKLEINIERESIKTNQDFVDDFPETSEKFTVRFDQLHFEGYIKFPTLELYIPEYNFRDIVQVKRPQLQEFLDTAFKNLENCVHLFKQPTLNQEPETPQNEDIYQELEDLPTIIKKVVKEKTFGGLVLFKSAEIHLKNISEANETEPQKAAEEQNSGRRVSIRKKKAAAAKASLLRIKVRDLVQFVKLTDGEIVNLIKKSIVLGEGQKLEINIEKESRSPDQGLVDVLPETSEKFTVEFDQSRYEGFIKFPTLELYIPESNFRDVVHLTRSQLQDLLNSAFKNLEDYTHIFKQPPIQEAPQTSPRQPETSQNEDIYAELEDLPTIIKKVVKEKTFGGLVLFKSAEIHLKNISEGTETEPQKAAEEQNSGRRVSIRKKKAAAAKSTLLRIKVRDLVQFVKLSEGEIVNLIKKSIVLGEGQKLDINIEKESAKTDQQRHQNALPETSEKFTVEFDQSRYEGFIKFPTLELYVPESNFRDVVQLTCPQLQDLLNSAFKNLEDYTHIFKQPPIQEAPQPSDRSQNEDIYAELENLPPIIKKVVKEKTFGGLVLFKSAEIHLKNLSEGTESEPQKAAEEQNSGRRVSIRKKKAAAAKATLLRIQVRDLVQFVKLSDEEIVNLIKKSIVLGEGQKLEINLQKENKSTDHQNPDANILPEVSQKFNVQIDQSSFEGFIKFPTLELYVPESNFRDVVHLTRSQLQELLNSAFKNLEDYTHIFKQPPIQEAPQTSPRQPETSQNENIYAELENLPTIIKKVVKEKTFGGLVLFKSAEIHLKNISEGTETEPQKAAEEQNSGRRVSIRKKKAAAAKSTLLRIKIRDLVQFVKLTDEEIVNLIKKSIVLGEGQKLETNIQKETTKADQQRQEDFVDVLPQASEKFLIQVDQSHFEGFIKFPTLELYIPETNFRDVIYLTRSQLQELLNSAFNNLENYTNIFKQPPVVSQESPKAQSIKIDDNMNDYPNDDKPLSYNQQTLSAKKI